MNGQDMRNQTNDKRFEHLDQELGVVGTKVAGLEAGQRNMESAFASLQVDIGRRFDQVVDYIKEQKPKQTNMLAIGAFTIALVGAGTAYIQTRLSPMEKSMERFIEFQVANLELEREQSKGAGALVERVSENEREMEVMWGLQHTAMRTNARLTERTEWLQRGGLHAEEVGRSVSELTGRLDSLESKVERIDYKGAVRWLDGQQPAASGSPVPAPPPAQP